MTFYKLVISTCLILFYGNASYSQPKLDTKASSLSSSEHSAISSESLNYELDKSKFEGFLFHNPTLSSTRPGILLIHDWMGLTERTKEKSKNLAALGYVVLAVDVYGKGVRPKDQKEAGALAGSFKGNRAKFRAHLMAGLKALKALPFVDSNNLAVMGYCFGGTGAIELAREGAPLKAAISFHGGLDSPNPADGNKIKARILALHGADDPFVAANDLTAFESEMRTAKVDWQLIKYGGAVHSFTDKSAGIDNSKGAAYNESADKLSWKAMTEFLQDSFSRK